MTVCPVLVSSCSLIVSGTLELVHQSCSHWGRPGLVLIWQDVTCLGFSCWGSLSSLSLFFFFLFHTLEESDLKWLVTDNIAIHYWYQARNLIQNYNPCFWLFFIIYSVDTSEHRKQRAQLLTAQGVRQVFAMMTVILFFFLWVWIGI